MPESLCMQHGGTLLHRCESKEDLLSVKGKGGREKKNTTKETLASHFKVTCRILSDWEVFLTLKQKCSLNLHLINKSFFFLSTGLFFNLCLCLTPPQHGSGVERVRRRGQGIFSERLCALGSGFTPYLAQRGTRVISLMRINNGGSYLALNNITSHPFGSGSNIRAIYWT